MAAFSGPQNGKGPDPVEVTLKRVSFNVLFNFFTRVCLFINFFSCSLPVQVGTPFEIIHYDFTNSNVMKCAVGLHCDIRFPSFFMWKFT